MFMYIFGVQLERERLDLQSQVSLLKESKEAAEEELKVQSAAMVHNADEVAQQRAESNALRFELLVISAVFTSTLGSL